MLIHGKFRHGFTVYKYYLRRNHWHKDWHCHWHKEVDAVDMGSPLGYTLANTFFEFDEKQWLKDCFIKLVSAIFYQFLILHQIIPFKNYKNFFLFHLKSSFCSRDLFRFLYFRLPLFFFPVSHCFRGWSKKKL